MSIKYKFDEGAILGTLQEYVDATYQGHYSNANDPQNIQAIDVWNSLGSLESTCRDNALKYLLRFGKKAGKNTKDLYKAMHYITLMIYAVESEKENKDATTSN